MSIVKLPTDYVDDVTSQYKYKLTNVDTDTVLVENVSVFSTQGSYYGASNVNMTNKTVNEVIDAVASNGSEISNIVNGKLTENEIVATASDTATSTSKLTSPVQINDVDFDGSEDITIDFPCVSKTDSFVLLSKGTLTFTSDECKITDENITEDSLAEVIIEPDSIVTAFKAVLTVETYDGYVLITAGRTPASSIVASIVIRS